MPWEEIGPCGGDGKLPEKEWRALTNKMGLSYVRFICGEPPKGCKLGLHWFTWKEIRQHSIALFWDPVVAKRAPSRYLSKCFEAVAIFDCAVPWKKLRKDKVLPLKIYTQKEWREIERSHQ